MTKSAGPRKPTTVRMPIKLHDKLKALLDRDGVPINKLIVDTLMEKFLPEARKKRRALGARRASLWNVEGEPTKGSPRGRSPVTR